MPATVIPDFAAKGGLSALCFAGRQNDDVASLDSGVK
jgi:hypothetical protein